MEDLLDRQILVKQQGNWLFSVPFSKRKRRFKCCGGES